MGGFSDARKARQLWRSRAGPGSLASKNDRNTQQSRQGSAVYERKRDCCFNSYSTVKILGLSLGFFYF